MDANAFMDWISSLNPIVIDVDEEGQPVDESQLDELTDRLEAEIKQIKDREGKNGHPQT
jgi:hypothetical protein